MGTKKMTRKNSKGIKHSMYKNQVLIVGDEQRKRVALLEKELENITRIKDAYCEELNEAKATHKRLKAQLEEVLDGRDLLARILYEREDQQASQLIELQDEINMLKETAEATGRELRQKAATEQASLREEVMKRGERLRIVEEELLRLSQVDEERILMKQQLQQIKETVTELTNDHQNVIMRMENRLAKEKEKMESSNEEMLQEITKKANATAICNLSRKTVEVFEQNKELINAVNAVVDENRKLKVDALVWHGETVRLRGNITGREDVMRDAFKRCDKLDKQLSKLTQEKQQLESELDEERKWFNAKYQGMEAVLEEEVSVNRVKLKRLESIVEIRDRELVEVRRMARDVLRQRGVVERFLGGALEHVKREITAEECVISQLIYRGHFKLDLLLCLSRRKDGIQLRSRHRSLILRALGDKNLDRSLDSRMQKDGFHAKVDWDELSWRQRERVLRYLFMQMNYRHVSGEPV